jgi:hypothetical protein
MVVAVIVIITPVEWAPPRIGGIGRSEDGSSDQGLKSLHGTSLNTFMWLTIDCATAELEYGFIILKYSNIRNK